MSQKRVIKTNEQWQQELSPEVYYICRLKGTEAPGSGKYDQFFHPGVYHCACCDASLFASKDKYDAETGWPSFLRPLSETFVDYRKDNTGDYLRLQVICACCHGHLGYLYNDGPKLVSHSLNDGLFTYRYSLNSLSLVFKKSKGA